MVSLCIGTCLWVGFIYILQDVYCGLCSEMRLCYLISSKDSVVNNCFIEISF